MRRTTIDGSRRPLRAARMLSATLSLAAVALGAACTASSGTPDHRGGTEPAWTAPRHPIQIDGQRFVDTRTGSSFAVRGVNYFTIVSVGGGFQDRAFSPAVFDAGRLRRDFSALAGRGYTTVRMFLDSCSVGPGCITKAGQAGLSGEYLDVIAQVLEIARDTGIFLLLTSNDLPDGGGYTTIADAANSELFPGYRNTIFLTTAGATAAAAYWDDLLAGLVQRRAAFEAVLAWSIVNEQWLFTDQPPLSLDRGTVIGADGRSYDLADPRQKRQLVLKGVTHYIETAAAVIRRHDPHGLVTMGFFAPKFPNSTSIGGDWYVDTAPLLAGTSLDMFDFHAYPGSDISIAEIAENFGMAESTAKPILMGEVGAFIDQFDSPQTAGLAVQRWVADSCTVGFSGWLYWGFYRAPEAIGDATWSLIDADGYLLDALAPVHWPDPCVMSLSDPNLARGRPVRASRALAGEPARGAVDGNPATQWGSGAHAPQWIEVSMAEPSTVGGIRLRVAQYPAGRTVHQVAVSVRNGPLTVVHTIAGKTTGGDVLETTFDEPISGVTSVRVTTTVSPSWVAWSEVEVLAAAR